jgi:LmbE family N-acetylglucosaminyl deacetylase
MPTLLAIVAHPDDETFGCGSLLLHAAAAGARTVVVCATRGEAGAVTPSVQVPERGLADLRESELRAAAAALSVTDVELLEYTDSGMDGEAAPGSLCAAPLSTVVEVVASAVAHHQPDVVVALDASDGHRDHARIRAAVEEVVAGSGTRLYLQALPRSLMHDWVRHHAGKESASAYVDLPEIGTPDEQITTVVDTSEHYQQRQAAIRLHASQASPFEGLPEELRRAFLATDHLVRVNPPWTGGELERDVWDWDRQVGQALRQTGAISRL